MKPLTISSIIAILVCLFSCNNDNQPPNRYVSDIDPTTWDSCNNTVFKSEAFNIQSLDYSELPYTQFKILSDDILTRERIYDEDSIPLILMKEKKVYFPTNLLQYTYGIFDQLVVQKKDTAALRIVTKIANKLIDLSLKVDSSIFISYHFDFPVHGKRSGETMKAPWYSAMAQGQTLSLYCRLYHFTKNQKHLEICHKLFNSFRKIKGQGETPWVSCIDKNGNLWLEEYPAELPYFTLNGKIFAIFGLYEYYQLTKSQEAKEILTAAITTIKVNIERFRVVGEPSFYCLKHKFCEVQYPGYHAIHIEQLNMLYAMTNDVFFANMALKLTEDTAIKE